MSFFHQITNVENQLVSNSRLEVIPKICKGKTVLHIGCVDWPVTDYNRNLHLNLDKVCKDLVGIDLNDQNFPEMLQLLKHKALYTNIEKVIDKHFDVLLIPEVIEHVDNVGLFLNDMNKVQCDKVIITVPDAFMCYKNHFQYLNHSEFHEIVHPDHNCWYSPYTLRNIVNKFTDWKLERMFFLESMSIMGIFKNEKV